MSRRTIAAALAVPLLLGACSIQHYQSTFGNAGTGTRNFNTLFVIFLVVCAIMLVATLLLAASGAGGVLAWGLPRRLRLSLAARWTSPLQRLWRMLTGPVTATVVQGAVMWLWHAPPLFDRALESSGWHIAQHSSFFVSALLFWWAMLHPRGRGSGYGVSAACLFVTSMIGGALGALMRVAHRRRPPSSHVGNAGRPGGGECADR